eukprot:7564850-Pyramimonas_sp.AAC.1
MSSRRLADASRVRFTSLGPPPILVTSAYLHHSEGLSDANLSLLAKLGTQLSDVGQPRAVGADFNFEPSELESSSFGGAEG